MRPTYYATITINRMDGAMDSIIRGLHLNEQEAVIDAMDFIKEMDDRYEMDIPWDELEYGLPTIKWVQQNRPHHLFVNIEWVPGELRGVL